MGKGNILVIGNSGVGKSTLINAVLGEDAAVTGFGPQGTTRELAIFENEEIPFRLIDTVGFEPSLLKEHRAIGAVKKWSGDSAKKGNEDSRIHVIWFCVDGTSRKLFPKAIQNLSRATSMWPSVPLIVVITKSYSVPERDSNIEMVYQAFAEQKRYAKNLKHVIPVVADTYVLNDQAYAAPEGIAELTEATNQLLPEGIKAAETDIANFTLKRKRAMAHSIVGIATAAGVVVGAVPIPFADALILGPVEVTEINALAKIYEIGKDENAKTFLNSIIEVGTVGAAAKAAVNALKMIPGLNLGVAVVNSVVAGGIVAALGESAIHAFEQVYLGVKTTDDLDWVKNLTEANLSKQFIEKITKIIESLAEKADMKTIVEAIVGAFQAS